MIPEFRRWRNHGFIKVVLQISEVNLYTLRMLPLAIAMMSEVKNIVLHILILFSKNYIDTIVHFFCNLLWNSAVFLTNDIIKAEVFRIQISEIFEKIEKNNIPFFVFQKVSHGSSGWQQQLLKKKLCTKSRTLPNSVRLVKFVIEINILKSKNLPNSLQ